jgi:hypothetical protein
MISIEIRASIMVRCKLAKWWCGGEKGGEREERLVVSLQPTLAQEPKIYVRELNESHLKCED